MVTQPHLNYLNKWDSNTSFQLEIRCAADQVFQNCLLYFDVIYCLVELQFFCIPFQEFQCLSA